MVRVLTAASVASTLLALCNGQLRVNERFDAASTPMLLRRGSDHVQQPLRQVDQESATKDLPPYKAGQFTRWAQDNSTCATYGESQWTGTIDVTDERRLFYWFFDSRNDPDNDPIIIWINGGPGGSSMMGLFNEMGPCWLEPGELETEPNPWSWNNNASLLFIDQPAGVGFATVAEGSRLPTADLDGAQDFQVFLGTFFGDVFPDRAGLPIHFAAESYGGHYAPTYVDHVLRSREMDAPTAFWGDIQSLILVDALIDFGPTFLGTYELLCTDHYGAAGILNQTACDGIRRSVPECERLGASCRVSYDGYECWAMFEYCVSKIASWYQEKVDQGERNPYNVHLDCPDPACSDRRKGNFTAFLNQDHVKKALHFPPSFTFSPIAWPVNAGYSDGRTPYKPTTRELAAVLEAHEARPDLRADVRLLVLQGNDDFIVNTAGSVLVYDGFGWSGQADFRVARFADLPADVDAATGFWKATPDQRLVFVALDGAGHTVPGDVREGSYQVVQKFIARDWQP